MGYDDQEFTHRLHSLDVAFYGPLKSAYSAGCKDYWVSHPGAVITTREVAEIFGKAFLGVCTVKIAVNGFKALVIEPLLCDIFTDEGFQASYTTDAVENYQLDSPGIYQQPISPALPPGPRILSKQPSTSSALPELGQQENKKETKEETTFLAHF